MPRSLRSQYRDLLRLREKVRALEMRLAKTTVDARRFPPDSNVVPFVRANRSLLDTPPRAQAARRRGAS